LDVLGLDDGGLDAARQVDTLDAAVAQVDAARVATDGSWVTSTRVASALARR